VPLRWGSPLAPPTALSLSLSLSLT